ncbi:MAG: HigA family addiction module antidote protein [Atopobiaceae bacterium]|nr:HigA family addiction module antidote protein [Atopobiaceae bacterium]
MPQTLTPITPGELLREEFLVPMGISQYRLAKETGIPAQRIGQIVLGRRAVTPDTDLRLCRFFGLTDGYWLRAQAAYDLAVARQRLSADLDRIVPWRGAARSL